MLLLNGSLCAFCDLPCAFCDPLWLNFLSEDRGLAPADRLTSPEPVLVHDPEVALSLVFHLFWRVALKAEKYLETNPDEARMNR